MSRRKYSYNVFETTLASGISSGATDLELTSVTNLRAPGYLVVDDDNDSLREVISFSNINGSTLQGCDRGLEGSASGAQAHDSGKLVRAVMVHQFIDDIFNDIEETEAELTAVAADLASTESAIVTLQGQAFSAADHAATDHGPIVAATFPAGTRLIFDQDTAPTGWTRDVTNANDRMIRIVTGTRTHGGSWDQGDHVHNIGAHAHTMSDHKHKMGDHAHSVPTHTHTTQAHTHPIAAHSHSGGTTAASGTTSVGSEGPGPNTFEYTIKAHTHTQGTTTSQTGGTATSASTAAATTASSASNTGSAGSSVDTDVPSTANTGTASGSTAAAGTASSWRPLHRDMIIAVKN